MTLEEAIAWLKGERSYVNLMGWSENTARTDAALTEQAYWIVRAHREGLLPTDLAPISAAGPNEEAPRL